MKDTLMNVQKLAWRMHNGYCYDCCSNRPILVEGNQALPFCSLCLSRETAITAPKERQGVGAEVLKGGS